MRAGELLRLVYMNLVQNKFKTIMTSIGIVVGAATIVMVIAIGRGGQMDVAEQFSNLNAGAIDVTYEYKGEEDERGGSGGGGGGIGSIFGSIGNMFGGMFGGGGGAPSGGGSSSGGSSSAGTGGGFSMPGGGGGFPGGGSFPGGSSGSDSGNGGGGGFSFPGDSSGGGFPGGGNMPDMGDMPDDIELPDGADFPGAGDESAAEEQTEAAEGEEGEVTDITDDRLNLNKVTLTEEDVDDISAFVSGIDGATISYSSKVDVEGAVLTDAESDTVAGVLSSYYDLSGLEMAAGEFISDADNTSRKRVCVLGSGVSKKLFGKAEDAVGQTLYLDSRSYKIIGVLSSTQTVSAGLSPDDDIFIPYATGIKYIVGTAVEPTVTVIAADVSNVDAVEADIQTVLAENYPNSEFSFSNAGSKMKAAEESNRILTMVLSAMALIVFVIGGIGIMNVFFVSVRERTNEIGILKALGASRKMILAEFLTESAAVSLLGGLIGLALSVVITPVVEHYSMRVEANATAYLAALGFAVLTGTLFGIYPAWKASRLVPVEALNAE